MAKNYHHLFNFWRQVEPPPELLPRLIACLRLAERQRARHRAWIFGFSTALSLVATAGLGINLAKGFAQTGFSSYLSLLLSGDAAILSYWRELGLALIDSLPAMGLLIFLAAATILTWSGTRALTALGNSRRLAQI